MFDPKILKENPEIAKKACQLKNVDIDIDRGHKLSLRRPEIIQELEHLRAEKNKVSEQIAMKKKNKEDAAEMIDAMKKIGPQIKKLEQELFEVETEFNSILISIPNLPHESVQEGGEEANIEISTNGKKPEFSFAPKPHWELAENLDILDQPRAAKLSGSGFALYKGLGAKLERALFSYFIDLHTSEHGYTEWFTPFLVNRRAMTGTGQLPKMEEDMYCTDKGDDLFLIPTAEVSLTNIHNNEILEQELPLKYTAYSACFRREAGAAGKDTRGIIRIHQFNKVEMVNFCHPDKSYEELERLRATAEKVLQNLGLHYRVLQLATGDISFAAAKCYDLEVWAPGIDRYLEVSSCSNFGDFQARRANIKFRDENGKPQFCHTLNGSGLACPRAWVAVVENYQQEDGSIVVPEVLRPYMGTDMIINN